MQPQSVKLVQSENGGEQFHIFLDKKVGQGGFGVVYEARSVGDKARRLVVKIMEIANQSRRASIESELKILSELPPHQNLIEIVPIKVCSCKNYYLFMEYCEGGSLFDLKLKRGKSLFTEDQIYQIFYQCLNGYKVLFDKGILHQDIKPDNILIRKNLYKLADFGLSIFYEGYNFGQTREGTLSYIAPQKLQVLKYIGNPKSDIYAFGVMFFELTLGQHPYIREQNKKQNYKEFMRELRDAKLRLQGGMPNRFSLQFNEFFENIILKMVRRTESSRISFEQIWEYVQRSDIFQKARSKQKELSKQFLIDEYDFVVSGVTTVLTLPISSEVSFSQEDILKQKERHEQQNRDMVQTGKEVANYFIKRRLIVYYIDRLARKFIVEELKLGKKDETYDRVVLYLMLFAKTLLNSLVAEIKTPDHFSIESLIAFKKTHTLAHQIIDLLKRDHLYVEDILCDLLSSSVLPKKETKQIFSYYRHNEQEILMKNLLIHLNELLKSKTELIDTSKRTQMVTLANLIVIVDVLEELQGWVQRAEQLQEKDKIILTSSTSELIELIQRLCEKRELMCGFDMTGLCHLDDSEMVIFE